VFYNAVQSFGSDDFVKDFKESLRSVSFEDLPLGPCCNYSSVIDPSTIEPVILTINETESTIEVKTGILFCEILSGCSCSDDPSKSEVAENSYCEIIVKINKESAVAIYINV
jgi:hypothetical protein